jgi:hypothetical protein
MGLEIPVLIQYARSIVDRAAVLAAEANRGGPDALGFSLWPEADGAED